MPSNDFTFTTGPSTLPDVGKCSYNGAVFSPLFQTSISGTVVKDAANRTVKLMEYVLTVDGYVTLSAGNTDIAPTMANLRGILSEQAGALVYKGRGFDLSVNGAGTAAFGNARRDVAWGPVPEILNFQPLGRGLSAKIVWRVTVRVVEITPGPLLQFNCDTVVSYGEDYFSSLSVRGTMEIPITRTAQGNRTLKATVDDQRSQLDARIFAGIDLSRFRVTRRNYSVSRDKRTMEFDVACEEKPYMDLPPGCTVAHGSFRVKQAKAGMGQVEWHCTLSASYVVRRGASRRMAWYAFLALLRLRMNQGVLGLIPKLDGKQDIPPNVLEIQKQIANDQRSPVNKNQNLRSTYASLLNQQGVGLSEPTNAWLFDLSFEEGVYQDSKTSSFSATYRTVTTRDKILMASGLWRKLPESDIGGTNLWETSVKDVSGSVSWLQNRLDPALDIVVDFGGG